MQDWKRVKCKRLYISLQPLRRRRGTKNINVYKPSLKTRYTKRFTQQTRLNTRLEISEEDEKGEELTHQTSTKHLHIYIKTHQLNT